MHGKENGINWLISDVALQTKQITHDFLWFVQQYQPIPGVTS